MRELTFDDFGGNIGKGYQLLFPGGALGLKLAEAQKLPPTSRQGGSFRLVFHGPFDPVLPQAIYPFKQGTDVHHIFIVPIARGPTGMHYEAIFA